MSGPERPGERLDLLFRGRVKLLQDPRGYRTSVDAMVLAFFARPHARRAKRTIDIGAGSGLVSVLLGLACPDSELHLVELQPGLADRAARNLALNGCADRARVHLHDVATGPPADLPRADLVVCNPPYYRPRDRLLPRHPERLAAHYETTADIAAFAAFAASVLTPAGRSCWIYPQAERERLLDALVGAGLGDVRLHELEHRPGLEPVTRILALARRGAARVRAGRPIALHPERGDESRYAEPIEAFLASLSA